MLASQRKTEIVDRVRREGSVIASELAAEWAISEDTVRRDLRELAADGLVQRVHGGAVGVSQAAADYQARTTVATASKAAVARAAAAMIQPGQTVFLDGGTTTAEICRALPLSLSATIVTHSPTVAIELVARPAVQVLLIGGTLYRHSVVAVGAIAAEHIGALHLDTFFMGVSGIHSVHGLTTGDPEEAAIKRAICRRATDTFVLGSSEKLGAALPHRVVSFGDVSGIITDERDSKVLGKLRRAGLSVVPAG